MALPKIQDLITYVSKVITGSDWNTNWQTVVSWLSSGNTDIKVKSIELSASGGIVNNGSLTQAGNVSIGGNLAVTGSVTGSKFTGDGSGLTGIVSSATVSYTPFAVNSGNVDVNGNGDILYFTGGTGTLNFKVGGTLPAYDSIVATSAQGVTFTLTQILDLDVSTYDDGTYVVCIKKNQTVAEVRGTVYRQIDEPTGNNGDLWLDIGKEGLVCYEKISGSWSNEYEGVPVGTITVASGVITAVTTFPYNVNGINRKLIKSYQNVKDWYNIFWQYDYNSQTIRKFVEQGGEDVTPSNIWSSSKAVTFLIPMIDTYYYANAATKYNSAVFSGSISTLLTTGMTVNTLNRASNENATSAFSWEVKGYIS